MDEWANPTHTTGRPISRRRIGLWLLGMVLAANVVDLITRVLATSPATSAYEQMLFVVQVGVSGLLVLLLAGAVLALRLRVRATSTALPMPHRYEGTAPMRLDLR